MSNPKVKKLLTKALPDLEKEISDELVDGVVGAMLDDWQPGYEHLDVEKPSRGREIGIYAVPSPGYLVRATHSRLTGAGKHEFTGEVPMARITLPKTQQHVMADTQLGQVIDGDHKLYSLEVFREYYKGYIDDVQRVDLVTPVRYAGHRFAAVAIYLVYQAKPLTTVDQMVPRAFVFEAGMATGQPMVLYASRDGQGINSKAGYKPTPFSSPSHMYRGSLTMNGDDPEAFTVEIRKKKDDAEPFFRLSATLERRDDLIPVNPFGLTLQAALRVCAIADARGEQVPDLGSLTGLLAPLGRNLAWNSLPERS